MSEQQQTSFTTLAEIATFLNEQIHVSSGKVTENNIREALIALVGTTAKLEAENANLWGLLRTSRPEHFTHRLVPKT